MATGPARRYRLAMSAENTERAHPEQADLDACACDEGEICPTCAGPDLKLLVELKLSTIWARAPREARERANAETYLAMTAANN
jgi:hypothetical protein